MNEQRVTKQTHPFNPWSFAAGIIFLAVGAGYMAHDHDVVTAEQLAIAAPLALIVLGVAGIALTLRRTS